MQEEMISKEKVEYMDEYSGKCYKRRVGKNFWKGSEFLYFLVK